MPIIHDQSRLHEVSTAADCTVRSISARRKTKRIGFCFRKLKDGQAAIGLFLCTGNYYRSRFAEVLFNSVAGKFGLSWRASSRGLALERGINNVGPMAASAITALETLGIHAAEAVTR